MHQKNKNKKLQSDRIPSDTALTLFVDLNDTDKCDFSSFHKNTVYTFSAFIVITIITVAS